MDSKSRINSIFFRYFLSAIVMVLLPVCLIVFFFYPALMQEAEKNAMRTTLDEVISDKYNMDTHLSAIYSIPKIVFQNASLRPYNIGESVYSKIIVSNELESILAYEPLIENIFYYLPEENLLFNHSGMYAPSDYVSYMFPYWFENRDVSDFMSLFSGPAAVRCLPPEPVSYYNAAGKNMVTFLAGVAPGSNQPYGYLAIMLYEEKLDKLLSPSLVDQALTLVMNRDGQVVLGRDDIHDQYRRLLDTFTFDEGDAVTAYAFEGEKYIIASSSSSLNDWMYVSIVPVHAAIGNIAFLERQSIIIIGIVVLLEIVLALGIAQKNYKPIKDISLLLPQGKNEVTHVGNELAVIKNGIQALMNTNIRIAEGVQNYSEAIREQLLRNVIGHKILSVEEFNRQGSDVGLSFKHELFVVAIVFVPQKRGDEQNNLVVREDLQDIHTPNLDGYFLHNYLNFMSLFVCSFSSDIILSTTLHKALEEVQKDLSITTITGIGESVSEIADIDVSFMQACATLEYMEINNENSEMKYSDLIERSNRIQGYPANHINVLRLALVKKNIHSLNEELTHLCEILADHKTPFYLIRSVYISTIQILMTFMIKNNDNERRKKYIYQIDHYLSVDLYNSEVLVQNIGACQKEIVAEIQRSLQSDNDTGNPIAEVLGYIDDHYCEYDFSAQKVSEKVDMTLPKFSQFFKTQTGQNFKNYLTTLRMNRACQLLTSSAESIEEIAEQVGYLSAISFIRVFKRYYAITPGKYRHESGKGR